MRSTFARFVTVVIVASVALGFGGSANAHDQSDRGRQVAVEARPAAVTLGPWLDYSGNFKSKATCEARAAVIKRYYGGNHYGAVGATRCVQYLPMICPPTMKWMLQVRYVTSNGPVAIPKSRIASGPTAVGVLCG